MKAYTAEQIRNVAIVGHGGAGKTMLAEHMLYTAGAIDRVGSVNAGTTQSDYEPLEVKRHISIGASVIPVEWNGCKINLIDVPGYADFAGELHAVARVVEAMIIVTEAKRDLDVGFETAWNLAEAHGLARFIFVNKLEQENADFEGLMDTLHDRYGRRIVSTQIPIGRHSAFSGILDLINMRVYKGKDRGVEVEEVPASLTAEAEVRREKMMDAAVEGDDTLALKYLEGGSLSTEEIERGLHIGTDAGRVVPVLFGSAESGLGVATLLDRIVSELPNPTEVLHAEALDVPSGETAAFVFKTTADPYVGRINFVRVFAGQLRQNETLSNLNSGKPERIHHLFFPHGKSQESVAEVGNGDIAALGKLVNTHTGDTLTNGSHTFPPLELPEPLYSVAVRPVAQSDEDKMGAAIARLLDEDPTLRFESNPVTRQDVLSGLGDIHIDTAIEKLRTKYGVHLTTETARVPYRETIRTSSKAQGRHKRQTGGKGQFGDCWIELTPLEPGEGFRFDNRVVGGAIPKNFIPAIEKGIREAMEEGVLAGYPLVDVRVTVYDGSYHDVDSSEAAFKTAGALALRSAVPNASPVILEPVLAVSVEVPEENVGDIIGDLNGRRGHLLGMDNLANGHTRIRADVPMATMQQYLLTLRSLTKGRGTYHASLSHYAELPPFEQEKLIQAHASQRHERELAHS